MDAPYPRFAMVAGESSGDLLAGLLLDGLHQRWSGLSACGIGGPQMTRRGFEAWWPHDKLSVHGYGLDVFLRVGELLAMRRRLKSRLLQRRPDVFIGVDAPDFNLALEASLRTQGVKTVHFVCPSIWAWRAERIDKIRRSVDHVLCIFPFEPALLAAHGIAIEVTALTFMMPTSWHLGDAPSTEKLLPAKLGGLWVMSTPSSTPSKLMMLCPRWQGKAWPTVCAATSMPSRCFTST